MAPVEDLLKDDDHEKEVRILTKEDMEECFVCYDPLWTLMQVKIHSCTRDMPKGLDRCPQRFLPYQIETCRLMHIFIVDLFHLL